MDYKALKWSVRDNPNNPGEPCIGVITLNRPEKLNAVDPLMRLELDALCNEIARNSIVKVVISNRKEKCSAPLKAPWVSPARTRRWQSIFLTICVTEFCKAPCASSKICRK